MHARFVKTVWENETRTIATLYFKPDRPYYFTAGQYADISIPHEKPDSRGMTRTMTFTSLPTDSLAAITTRLSEKNGSSYKQAIRRLKPTAQVSLTDAMGDMVLPLDSTVPLVFVAGGVGIASFVSMIKWLTAQKDRRDVTLIYTVRDTSDIIFQDQFDVYAKIGSLTKLVFTTDNKVDGLEWKGVVHKSRLTSADIAKYLKPDSMVYISGTESMVEQLHHELEDIYKMPQYRIAFDFFGGYAADI